MVQRMRVITRSVEGEQYMMKYIGVPGGEDRFLQDTSVTSGLRTKTLKLRGPGLVFVDSWLIAVNNSLRYGVNSPTPGFLELLRSAKAYLRELREKRKRTNVVSKLFESESSRRRRAAVKTLIAEAYSGLVTHDQFFARAFALYEGRKSGGASGVRKSLSGHYQQELNTYRQSNKSVARSMQGESLEHAFIGLKKQGNATGNQTDPLQRFANSKGKVSTSGADAIEQMDDGELVNLITTAEKHGVGLATRAAFMDRLERLRFMKIPRNGKLRNLGESIMHDRPYQSTDGGEAWVMDVYGNLYCHPDTSRDWEATKTNGKRQVHRSGAPIHTYRFNHSCLCAGNEVICAGMIMTDQNGKLTLIDNNSGHYKPGTEHMRKAMDILANEFCLDLSGAEIGYVDTTRPVGMDGKTYPVTYKPSAQYFAT